MNLRSKSFSRLFGVSKIVLAWVGLLVLLMVGCMLVFGWYYSRDRFDHADQDEALAYFDRTPVEQFRLPPSAPSRIDIRQSKVVIYGHQEEQITTQCKGTNPQPIPAVGLRLEHNACIVFVPPVPITITINQATVTVVRPRANMDFNLWQAQLKLALADRDQYTLKISSQDSHVELPRSIQDAPVTLTIEAEQSEVVPYHY